MQIARGKLKIVGDNEIDYIYPKEFECEDFEIRSMGEEGFHMYEICGRIKNEENKKN